MKNWSPTRKVCFLACWAFYGLAIYIVATFIKDWRWALCAILCMSSATTFIALLALFRTIPNNENSQSPNLTYSDALARYNALERAVSEARAAADKR